MTSQKSDGAALITLTWRGDVIETACFRSMAATRATGGRPAGVALARICVSCGTVFYRAAGVGGVVLRAVPAASSPCGSTAGGHRLFLLWNMFQFAPPAVRSVVAVYS